jgi:hypothetical protein
LSDQSKSAPRRGHLSPAADLRGQTGTLAILYGKVQAAKITRLISIPKGKPRRGQASG